MNNNIPIEKGRISVISPCYNVGHVIKRYLDSLLSQTYQKLEIILVDDGSTDNTKDVIESYVPALEDRGMKFKYIYQTNRGLGGAIDTGLKYFTGEYLCWPDPDDFLENDAMEYRKRFLDNHPEVSGISCNANIRDGRDIEKIVRTIKPHLTDEIREDMFDRYLRCDNIIFCSGCHMIRSADFLRNNPTKCIYPSRHGQNWQMMLFATYQNRFAISDKVVYNYIEYSNSLSRSYKTYEKQKSQTEGFYELLTATLDALPMKEDRNEAKELAQIEILHRRCSDAWTYFEKEDFIHSYSQLLTLVATKPDEDKKREYLNSPKFIQLLGDLLIKMRRICLVYFCQLLK